MENRKKEFLNPGPAYRGKPFWSWNGRLEKNELLRQIDVLKEMGMGGFFCHSRTGLATEYLGDEWFDLINACAEKGQAENMETWLYDEDRWPSGTAGGMVTENKEYRIHYLRLNVAPAKEFAFTGEVIAAFFVRLSGQSFTGKRRVQPGDAAAEGETALYFTSEEQVEYSFYNGETYVDTMNPEATKHFIEITHEKYREKCGKYMQNGAIKGIFTDEPHHGGVMNGFALLNKEGNNLTPYPKNLFSHFEKQFGYDLADYLPELFLLSEGKTVHPVKWQYMYLLNRLFVENYLTPIQEWCHAHNQISTGHLLHEDSLGAQAVMNGSMASGYEAMDYPGVDVLWETNPDYVIVKQLQSTGRQLNKPWLMSELYGCSGWQMTFANHKGMGDWQALFGINLRCHHLSWYTMQGEAKRDYPGSIFFQQEWYKEYAYVEDYYARLHAAMLGGQPVCDTLYISPVESFWASIRPGWMHSLWITDETLQKLDKQYKDLFWALLNRHIDFDYGDEGQLQRLGKIEAGNAQPELCIGGGRYKNIIISASLTLRQSTVDLLERFMQAGGKVIIAGDAPAYIDALPSENVLPGAVRVPFEGDAIAAQLTRNPYVQVSAPEVIMQTNKEGAGAKSLLMNLNREETIQNVTVSWQKGMVAEKWDARTGTVTRLPGNSLTMDFAPCQELLLVLAAESAAPVLPALQELSRTEVTGPFAYRLNEPNVLVMDAARWKLNNEEWQPALDILRIDRKVRDALSLPYRFGEMLQPWYKEKHGITGKGAEADLTLSFAFRAEKAYELNLLMESPKAFRVTLNGQSVDTLSEFPWFIDPCFKSVPLPKEAVKEGENELLLTCRFHDGLDLEAVYLLGNFGVKLDGLTGTLTDLPALLQGGDIAPQGLPFYSGAIDYVLPNIPRGKRVFLETEGYNGACVTLRAQAATGEKKEIMAFAPYSAEISEMENPVLRLHLTRRNTFGPMHINPVRVYSYGPDSFITQGEEFIENGYSLIENGLSHPLWLVEKE